MDESWFDGKHVDAQERASARSSRGLVPRLSGTAVYRPVRTVVWDPWLALGVSHGDPIRLLGMAVIGVHGSSRSVCCNSFAPIDPHPVDLHISGVIFGIGIAHPASADLHRENDIHRVSEGPLLRPFCRVAFVGKGVLPIDEEEDAVGVPLDPINVEIVPGDWRRSHVIVRLSFLLRFDGVRRMDCLIHDIFEVEMLHDVDLAARRPAQAGGEQPDGRPRALSALEAGANLQPAVEKVELAAAGHPASEIGRGILLPVLIDQAMQAQQAILQFDQMWIIGHRIIPIGSASLAQIPLREIELRLVKLILPD